MISYPGEQAVFDTGVVSGSQIFIQGTSGGPSQSYISLLNMTFQNGSSISFQTQDGVTPSQSHDILVRNMTMNNSGQIGTISGFNGINNVVIELNQIGDNLYMHGIYLGSRQLPGTQDIIRWNAIGGNNWAGIHWNGRLTYGEFDQNILWGNGNNGLTMQNGVSQSFMRSNLSIGNDQGFMQFYNYQGVCGDPGSSFAQYICPYRSES